MELIVYDERDNLYGLGIEIIQNILVDMMTSRATYWGFFLRDGVEGFVFCFFFCRVSTPLCTLAVYL